uniref:Thioredoxin domain-containing protein n=1 Tax=Aplanochytrium stocchinoi TaxID=215587 RepID=A0A7S3PSE5_9STRA
MSRNVEEKQKSELDNDRGNEENDNTSVKQNDSETEDEGRKLANTEEEQVQEEKTVTQSKDRELAFRFRESLGSDAFYSYKIGQISTFERSEEEIKFKAFRGKVVIITNTTFSFTTDVEHSLNLEELNNICTLYDKKVAVIIAWCEQWKSSYDKARTSEQVADFANKHEFKLHITKQMDVDGGNMHELYRFMKSKTSSEDILGDFGAYFVVDSVGCINGRYVSIAALRSKISFLVNPDFI